MGTMAGEQLSVEVPARPGPGVCVGGSGFTINVGITVAMVDRGGLGVRVGRFPSSTGAAHALKLNARATLNRQ